MTLQWVDNQGLCRGVQGQCPAPQAARRSGDAPPRAVILVTPLIPAIGWDEWGDGNPEEQRQPSWYSRYISTGAVGCAFVKGVPC